MTKPNDYYPKIPHEASALAMERYFVAEGHYAASSAFDKRDDVVEHARSRSLTIVNAFGLALLMRSMRLADAKRADQVAREMWRQWDWGDSLGEQLHAWAEEHGIRAALDAERPRGTHE